MRRLVSLILAVFGTSGCAHYYLPAHHLESPEARGEGKIGRIAIGTQGGTDLVATPTHVTPPPPDPKSGAAQEPAYDQLQGSMVNPFFGYSHALTENLDAELRLEPLAPLQLRGKYQFLGLPQSKAGEGNLSLAVSGGAGLLLGTHASQSVSFMMFDGALLAGYRIWKRHLFSLVPSYTMGALSGYSTQPTSGNQLGLGVGYQYDNEDLFLRLEAVRLSGSSAATKISGISFGAEIGLTL